MKVDMSVKNQMFGILAKVIVCGILVHVIVLVIKHIKSMNIEILNIARAKNF